MIGTTSGEKQSEFSGDGDRSVLRLAGAVAYFVLAASMAGGVMWLLPASTPEPARNGVGMAAVVMLGYPLVKMSRDGGLVGQATTAVLAGGIAVVVSWALRLILGG